MSSRTFGIAVALCLLGGVSFWTLERTTRGSRCPYYHCEVPTQFDDRDRDEVGRPSTPSSLRFLELRYYKYKIYHWYGWMNAQSEWMDGTKMKSTPVPKDDVGSRAMVDGSRQFHREKERLVSFPDLSN